VSELRVTVRHEPGEEGLEVVTNRRIGVLLDHEAGRGVANEQCAEPFADPGGPDGCGYGRRDLREAPPSADREDLAALAHLEARGENQTAPRPDLFRQAFVAEPRNTPGMPAVRRLDLTKNLSVSLAEHFHHGLLG
jgi:hypothetical protein